MCEYGGLLVLQPPKDKHRMWVSLFIKFATYWSGVNCLFPLVSILTSTYEDQFQIIPRKLLRRCNLADYTERGGLLDSRKELRTMSPKSQLQWKQSSGMYFCFGNHIFWHQDCWRAKTASWSWTWRYHPWNHEWSGTRDWRRCRQNPENSGSNKQFFTSIKHYFFFLRL